MPRPPRIEQFSPNEVCICHCVQRCVRRAYLAGVDHETGMDYSHRKEWIRRRMESLASVFGIDVLAYAIMSNHLHVILRNRPDVVAELPDEQIAIRWLRVFPGRRLEDHLGEPTEKQVESLAGDKERIAEIRRRLSDISWFMRSLAEPIARMANKQDECTGRFWEGRFKAQRILDDAGLLACSMYVDLNPVRAAMAESAEESKYTSVHDRLRAAKGKTVESAAFELTAASRDAVADSVKSPSIVVERSKHPGKRRRQTGQRILADAWLARLTLQPESMASDTQRHTSGLRASDRGFLTISWSAYLRILRWSASCFQTSDESSAESERAPSHPPPTVRDSLNRLGFDPAKWPDLVRNWPKFFGKTGFVGKPETLRNHARLGGRRFHRGQAQASCCFSTPVS